MARRAVALVEEEQNRIALSEPNDSRHRPVLPQSFSRIVFGGDVRAEEVEVDQTLLPFDGLHAPAEHAGDQADGEGLAGAGRPGQQRVFAALPAHSQLTFPSGVSTM